MSTVVDATVSKEKAKAERMAKYLDLTLNATALILTVLKEASGAAPVPGLKIAAGSALTILNAVQDMGDNKAGFQHLSKDVAEDTFTLVQFTNESINKGKKVSKPLEDNITQFESDLEAIRVFVLKQLKRNWFIRMIHSKADKLKIAEFRERLHQAKSRFQIVMSLNIHETVIELAERELERRGGIENIGRPAPPPQLLEPTYAHDLVTKPQAITSNTNSGNVKISNTINSNNDNSVKIGPARGPRRGPKRNK